MVIGIDGGAGLKYHTSDAEDDFGEGSGGTGVIVTAGSVGTVADRVLSSDNDATVVPLRTLPEVAPPPESSIRSALRTAGRVSGSVLRIMGITAGLIVAATAVLSLASYQAPAGVRQSTGLDVVDRELNGRLALYFEKAVGHLPEFSWSEVALGTFPGPKLGGAVPGSGFISMRKMAEGRGLSAAVNNPLVAVADFRRGAELFHDNCSPCHGQDGRGGHGPSLVNGNYRRVGSSDLALYTALRDGIPDTAMQPVDLTVAERWQVISHLRSLAAGDAVAAEAQVAGPSLGVTWADILDARKDTASWLTYSGGLDGWRHSPLTGITAENAPSLKLRWVHQFRSVGDGIVEATPIVAGGTMFLTLPPSGAVAIDAKTGREIWRFDRRLPPGLPICCGVVNRGMALLGDTLFMGTLDARLIALDARTGKPRWETEVAESSEGFSITVAPLVVKDMVIVGVAGGEYGIRGFLAAYDAATGEERWRFTTVPGPGEPGHETWENDAWKTGGGPTWVTGVMDPDLNLIYWGVGNPSPNYQGALRPGDNLYTNSVVALDADTGKLAWHFQFTPHDEHDWDSNQTPMLADVTVGGVPRKAILWANRNGFYYVLDRATGEFLAGRPYVKVTWASGLDPKGRPILTEAAKVTESGVLTSPSVAGGTNWPPPSFDPTTGTVFVHATEGSSVFTAAPEEEVERGENNLYLGSGYSSAGPIENVIVALDAATGTERWRYPIAAGEGTDYPGMLSTAGGVVMSAKGGVFVLLDSRTGKELWRADLGGITKAPPITFTVDGSQVVAITAGNTLFMFGL